MGSINTIIGTGIILSVMATACAHPRPGGSGDPGTGNNGFYDGVVGVYTESLNHLSAVRRGGCPMHPSCAQYSRQAVERHGFIVGWVMTMDRLLRCGRDELKRAPRVFVNGNWKYYDPVDHYTFGRQPDQPPLSEIVAALIKQQETVSPVEPEDPLDSAGSRLPPAYSILRETQ